MSQIKFFQGDNLPLEMHKVRIVQKLNLIPVEQRMKAMSEAGNNTFLLHNRDVFLDMLTDSGVNAMSDRQLAAMMEADDSYAGSETFFRLEAKIREIFGTEFFLPAHQGRACFRHYGFNIGKIKLMPDYPAEKRAFVKCGRHKRPLAV